MKRIYYSLAVILLLVSFSGCVTASKSADSSEAREEIGALQTRIEELEKGQDELEKMIVNQISVQEEPVKTGYVVEAVAKKEVISNPTKKDIQIALKNAGYYIGDIDGKVGPKTTKAIMEFQKENGLKVDGIVGSKTWQVLGQYYE